METNQGLLNLLEVNSFQTWCAVLFGIAVLHTFVAASLRHWAHKFPADSVRHQLLHLLGEVEVVFGIWGSILIGWAILNFGFKPTIHYLESRNFTEAIFVFAIMVTCATRPVTGVVERVTRAIANMIHETLRVPSASAKLFTILFLGPLSGSFITEPAAMTICALLLRDDFFARTRSTRLKYAMIGVLFVNVSVGGTLTSFAAPPVLMVAGPWKWDTWYMLTHFGWKAATACFINAIGLCMLFARELKHMSGEAAGKTQAQQGLKTPLWLSLAHFVAVGMLVLGAHYPVIVAGVFMMFLGMTVATKKYQGPLQIKEGMLVGYFLAGLVVLGGGQGWWLSPILQSMGSNALFWAATGLTAITDNAALAYLATLVPDLSTASKYSIIAGAVTGGGLTVIANAPNPAGYGILSGQFGDSGIKPQYLFLGAVIPTLVTATLYLLFINLWPL